MDELVMMINQGINEVIADGFARDRGQRLSPVENSGTHFVTIKTSQLGSNSFISRQAQIYEIAYLVCESHFERNQLANKCQVISAHFKMFFPLMI